MVGGGRNTLRVGNHTIAPHPFADDVVVLGSSQDLQSVLGLFAAKFKVAAMRISTSFQLENGGLSSVGWWRAPASGRAGQVCWSLFHK